MLPIMPIRRGEKYALAALALPETFTFSRFLSYVPSPRDGVSSRKLGWDSVVYLKEPVEQAHSRRCANPQRLPDLAPGIPLTPLLPHLLGGNASAGSAHRMICEGLGRCHRDTSTVSPRWSHGASVRSCLTPRYRSVVMTDACPRLSWICSRAALPLCASLANVRRRS
jgi:hypothetical protein